MPEINLYFPTPIYIETDLFDAKQNQIWNERLYKLQETVESGVKGGKVIHILPMPSLICEQTKYLLPYLNL